LYLTDFVPKPILKELVKVKVESWFNLGLELDIEDDELQTIERNHPKDQESCKRDMFRTWLRICPQASYRQLVQALVELGDMSEADRLCKKHGKSCRQLIPQRVVKGGCMQLFMILLSQLGIDMLQS